MISNWYQFHAYHRPKPAEVTWLITDDGSDELMTKPIIIVDDYSASHNNQQQQLRDGTVSSLVRLSCFGSRKVTGEQTDLAGSFRVKASSVQRAVDGRTLTG
jgi:hypothetical protein